MDIKLEHFLQKSGLTNTHIPEKIHLEFFSNFAKNNSNIWTKTSRLAALLKMANKNFDHNSVNIEKFHVLSFDFS
jgi:hypothetical protein